MSRYDVKVMGVVIGSCSDEDFTDVGAQYFDFEPVYANPNLEGFTVALAIDPWEGTCVGYDQRGNERDLTQWLKVVTCPTK